MRKGSRGNGRALALVLMFVVASLAGWHGWTGGVAWAAPGRGKAGAGAKLDETKLQQEMYALSGKRETDKAIAIGRVLLAHQKKAYGLGDGRTKGTAVFLASQYQLEGQYATAAALYRELYEAADKAKQLQDVASYASTLGSMYWMMGRLAEADTLQVRALELQRQLHGPKSDVYALALMSYAAFLSQRGAYSASLRAYEETIALLEAGTSSLSTGSLPGAMQSYASMLWQAGQQAKAIKVYDRLLARVEKDTTTPATGKAGTIFGVASMYHYGGRPDLARPLFDKGIAVYEAEAARMAKANPKDPMIPSTLGLLGMMLKNLEQWDRAEAAVTRAIAADEALPYNHGGSSWYATLSDIKRGQNKPREALALLDKAEAWLVRSAGERYRSTYNTMKAMVLGDLGEHAKAIPLLDAYIDNLRKTMGKRHPTVGSMLYMLATQYLQAGQAGKAEVILDESLDIAESDLALTLSTGNESDHAVYFTRNAYVLDTAINLHAKFAPSSTRAARLAVTTLLRRKGRILDAAAASLAALRARLSASDATLLDQLAEARARLSKLTVAGPEAGQEEAYGKEVAALEDKVRRLEEQARSKSASYRVATQRVELAAVQKAIPAGARLVEFLQWQPFELPWNPKKIPAKRYLAYVIASKGDPVRIELGEVGPIDEAIEKFRTAVADPDNDRARERGRALYDLTMAKIEPALGGATNLLLAPDGQLNLVAFAALVDGKGQFLVQRHTMTYLTSGRDLLRGGVRAKAKSGALIIADPAFDGAVGTKPATASPSAASAAAGTTRGLRSRDLGITSWEALPGTGEEADAVSKVLPKVSILRGGAATETAVKRIKAPRILHMATHGFFLPDDEVAAALAGPPTAAGGATRQLGPMGASLAGAVAPAGAGVENPLLRSGLALAGANKLASGEDDGILTALEATSLDLWGTKLVVLSACETAVGKVTTGDGVHGLRRALVVAGAETMVMSLWQVDDAATRDLMTGLYRRLGKREGRSQALRSAQLELLATRQYQHPFFWAAFLPAGESTPIKD